MSRAKILDYSLKLIENLIKDCGVICGTLSPNLIQFANLVLWCLFFIIFFVMVFHYPLALINLCSHLKKMEKLEENLECVTLPLVLGNPCHMPCLPIKLGLIFGQNVYIIE
jgi:hypothetical protein